MKKSLKHSIVLVLTVFFILVALSLALPIRSLAATTPSLGQAATYGVLANTYTNSGAATTTINGDVGFLVAPTVPPGGTHTNYGSNPPYATAGTDQASALTALNNQACTLLGQRLLRCLQILYMAQSAYTRQECIAGMRQWL